MAGQSCPIRGWESETQAFKNSNIITKTNSARPFLCLERSTRKMKPFVARLFLLFVVPKTFAQRCPGEIRPPALGVWDVDHVLSTTDRTDLENLLQDSNICLQESTDDASETTNCPRIQISVAIVDHIDAACFPTSEDLQHQTEKFARDLHDNWGVGQKTQDGDTGVLVFIALQERSLFISRGNALDDLLNDDRIDKILDHMRQDLKQAQYLRGIAVAVDDIVHFVKKGEPNWKETFLSIENLFVVGWFSIFIYRVFATALLRRRERAYAQAASHLTEIDRAQAEALHGRYENKSCPICLEDFQSSQNGSDGKPIKLLRCGHAFDETCWAEWISTGQGNITKCPICKMDVGHSHTMDAVAPPSNQSPQVEQSDHSNPDEEHDESSPLAEVTTRNVQQPGRELRRFQQERNFRLVRLQHRFPEYISRSDVLRWSSPTQNGSLVRDPTFSRHEPRPPVQNQRSQRGLVADRTPRSTFGGGQSSGGRFGSF